MEKEKLKEIGLRLMLARREKGMTQKEVANRMGISQASYNKLEAGKISMDIQRIIRICHILNIHHEKAFGEIKSPEKIDDQYSLQFQLQGQENYSEEFLVQYNVCLSVLRGLDKRILLLRKKIQTFESGGYGFSW